MQIEQKRQEKGRREVNGNYSSTPKLTLSWAKTHVTSLNLGFPLCDMDTATRIILPESFSGSKEENRCGHESRTGPNCPHFC